MFIMWMWVIMSRYQQLRTPVIYQKSYNWCWFGAHLRCLHAPAQQLGILSPSPV